MLAAFCYKHVNVRLISGELPRTVIAFVLGPLAKTTVAINRPHRLSTKNSRFVCCS
jgi:hypothetical protein